jgi:hypothetical protein
VVVLASNCQAARLASYSGGRTSEDDMSSMKPRDLAQGEMVSPFETFSWQEDMSVTERRRERRNRAGIAIVGVTLAALVLCAMIAHTGFLGALALSKMW